jgi:hypothetical protein
MSATATANYYEVLGSVTWCGKPCQVLLTPLRNVIVEGNGEAAYFNDSATWVELDASRDYDKQIKELCEDRLDPLYHYTQEFCDGYPMPAYVNNRGESALESYATGSLTYFIDNMTEEDDAEVLAVLKAYKAGSK